MTPSRVKKLFTISSRIAGSFLRVRFSDPLRLRNSSLPLPRRRAQTHAARKALPRGPGSSIFSRVVLGEGPRGLGVPSSSTRAGEGASRYRWPVSSQRVPGGVVHKVPADLRKALIANTTALDAWQDITPLARNEFICWVEDAKKEATRERRIRRTQEELEEGQRRPCCWPGCSHRERNGK